MKIILAILMALAVTLSLAAGALAEAEVQAPVFTTMGEAMDENISAGYKGWWDGYYASIVTVGGRFYRVVAMLDDESAKKMDAINQLEDYEEMFNQLNALAASLPVTYTEDISGTVKDQKELDALVGKTIGELEAEGYVIGSHGGGEGNITFTMYYGLFSYDFQVDTSYDAYLERNETENFGDLKVTGVTFVGASPMALDLSYQADGTHIEPEPEEDDGDFSDLLSTLLDTLLESLEDESSAMPEAAAAFEGTWACDRAFIDLNWEEMGFKVLIVWSSSARENTEWEYSCYYMEDSNSLVSLPLGTRTDFVYDDAGEVVSSNVIYEDGEATFTLDEEGHLIWQDAKENAGEGMRFERLAAEAQ